MSAEIPKEVGSDRLKCKVTISDDTYSLKQELMKVSKLFLEDVEEEFVFLQPVRWMARQRKNKREKIFTYLVCLCCISKTPLLYN